MMKHRTIYTVDGEAVELNDLAFIFQQLLDRSKGGNTVSQRTVTLGDLLDNTQSLRVSQIIQSIRSGSKPETLREYLVTQRESLEARGVLPEYLYYSLCYQFNLFKGE